MSWCGRTSSPDSPAPSRRAAALEGGNGGQAEVSGKAKLDYTGFTDLSAAHGAFGTLLLDPYNVIISSGTNNTGGSFDADTNDSIINVATLQTALGAAERHGDDGRRRRAGRQHHGGGAAHLGARRRP